MLHDHAFALALRLLAGEVVELRDEFDCPWRATAGALLWCLGGKEAPVLEGTAADVAIEAARRRLFERR